MDMEEAAREFLAQERIAVAGVSRSGQAAANAIYKKLKDTGHQVFAVNPNATEIEGQPCYPDLSSIPAAVDGVVMVTAPAVTEQLVRQCVEAGIPRVWMHRALGNSVSMEAVRMCEENGITVIAGGCPMMFQDPVDFGHKCLKWWFRLRGTLPK